MNRLLLNCEFKKIICPNFIFVNKIPPESLITFEKKEWKRIYHRTDWYISKLY
jgi:hypothetical protein